MNACILTLRHPNKNSKVFFFQFLNARLRDILWFSQAHALKCAVQLKVIKGKNKTEKTFSPTMPGKAMILSNADSKSSQSN